MQSSRNHYRHDTTLSRVADVEVEVLANAGVAGVGVSVEEPAVQVLHEATHEGSVYGGT